MYAQYDQWWNRRIYWLQAKITSCQEYIHENTKIDKLCHRAYSPWGQHQTFWEISYLSLQCKDRAGREGGGG